MKTGILTIVLFFMSGLLVIFYPAPEQNATAGITGLLKAQGKPKIQIAILLDTSSSMSGLISQTREQLWQTINAFSRTKKNGITPVLEVAVYEYGNNRLDARNGYIRQLTPLTPELDAVSEALFSLTTNGGEEYCGYVINTATNELEWSTSDNDIKIMFIAGNEPFTQGPVSFRKAIANARKKGITINTIYAGDNRSGMLTGWNEGALLAGGEFMNINHNKVIAHINAPQDKELAILSNELNKTYIPYGKQGRLKKQRQIMQDEKSSHISSGLMAKRAYTKASPYYNNSGWDLVDAIKNKKTDLARVRPSTLPAPLKKLTRTELKNYIEKQAEKRKLLKKKIRELGKQRRAYVARKRLQMKQSSDNTVNDAMTAAIKKEAKRKNYHFR